MGGVQAQYAPSIYIGLWSRVEGLERGQVTRALERRALVQATLLRNTIHVVSPGDYWQFAEATRDCRRSSWLQARAKRGPDRREVEAAARSECGAVLEDGPADARRADAARGRGHRALQRRHDLARRGARAAAGTWEHRRADIYALAEAWLEREEPEHPRRHTVARYLAAFGPGRAWRTSSSWSGIPPAELKPVLESMELRRFQDERRRSCCRPPAAPAAGPLDRRRRCAFSRSGTPPSSCTPAARGILPERFRPEVFSTKTPQSVPTFTVDGQVAGTWREEKGKVRVEAVRAAAEGGPPRGRRGGVAAGTVHRMSESPEERCRLAYARFSAGDIDGMLELFHPDVEVFVAPPNFESGTYCGHDEYRGLLERWGASWDEMRMEPVRLSVAGDWVLADRGVRRAAARARPWR